MAKTLSFETGLVDYDINGAYVARFNPADESFAQKLYEMIQMLDDAQDGLSSSDGLFEGFGELDAQMRAAIDGLLGEGAAAALFPGMNCYALSGGLPVWVNLALALADEVAEAFAREYGETDARLASYTGKYKAMMEKYRMKG
jgi:hypothetical protein